MTDALDNARAAMVHARERMTPLEWASIDALIAEHERLTAPPTDDEHEALASAIFNEYEMHEGSARALATRLIENGFGRRQGPVTEAEVEAALEATRGLWFSWAEATPRECIRAALEAARGVIA